MEKITLKDIEETWNEFEDNLVSKEKLKEEAIKWVKEDLENIKLRNDFGDIIWEPIHMTKEWMKRFNITEGDLK